MTFHRDPLSERFDQQAWRLVGRAYAQRGRWTVTYLAPPSPGSRAWAAGHGIDVDSRDPWGEVRWVRSFKRSSYWVLKHHGYAAGLRDRRRVAPEAAVAMRWQTVGPAERPEWGGPGWEIRVMIVPGGRAAYDAAGRIPEAERYTGGGLRSLPDVRGF